MKIVVAGSLKILATSYRTTWHQNAEDNNINLELT
jgi:hypothetical protein